MIEWRKEIAYWVGELSADFPLGGALYRKVGGLLLSGERACILSEKESIQLPERSSSEMCVRIIRG